MVVGRMYRGEGAWAVCVRISCTGDGALEGVGQGKCRKS